MNKSCLLSTIHFTIHLYGITNTLIILHKSVNFIFLTLYSFVSIDSVEL